MRLIICSFLLSVLGCSEHKIESVSDPNATGDTASMTQTTTSSTSTTGTTTTGTTTGTTTTGTTTTTVTTDTTSALEDCPRGFFADYGAYSFFFCPEGHTWEESDVFCTDIGMALAKIDHAAMNEWMGEQTLAYAPPNSSYPEEVTWVGLTRNEFDAFVWMDGSEAGYTEWTDGAHRPGKADEGRDCTTMITNTAAVIGDWMLKPCDDPPHAFVCRAGKGTTSTSSTATSTTSEPVTACASGNDNLSPLFAPGAPIEWNRSDMAYCESPDNSKVSAEEGAALCSPGWHVCSSAEFRARNDDCTDAPFRHHGVLDSSDCTTQVSHGEDNYCWNDNTRESIPGDCGGPTGPDNEWSMTSWIAADSESSNGAMCCL